MNNYRTDRTGGLARSVPSLRRRGFAGGFEDLLNANLQKICLNEALKDLDGLIFKGGGVRGVAFAGALQCLEEYKLTKGIHMFAGSSVGAITAALLACGYKAEEIKPILLETDFVSFKDNNSWWFTPNWLSNLWNMYFSYGMYSGDVFEKWMSDLIAKKTNDPNITLNGLFKLNGNVLETTGSNVSRKRVEYFNYKTKPDMRVALAVRLSMSVPGYFRPIQLDSGGLKDYYVDGGMLDNFPLNHFKDHFPNKRVLGLRLISNDDCKRVDIKNGEQFISELIDAMMLQMERNSIRDFWHECVCNIDTKSISSFDFGLTNVQKEALIVEGYQSVRKACN